MGMPKRTFSPHEQEMIRVLGRSGAALDDDAAKVFNCGKTHLREAWRRLANYDDQNERVRQMEEKQRRSLPPPRGKRDEPDLGDTKFPDDPKAIEADRLGRARRPETIVLGGSSLW